VNKKVELSYKLREERERINKDLDRLNKELYIMGD